MTIKRGHNMNLGNTQYSWKVKYKNKQGSIMTNNPVFTNGGTTPSAIEEQVKKQFGKDLDYEQNKH
jgi:hypothetical protein